MSPDAGVRMALSVRKDTTWVPVTSTSTCGGMESSVQVGSFKLGKAEEFLNQIECKKSSSGEVSELHHARCVTLVQANAYGLLRDLENF